MEIPIVMAAFGTTSRAMDTYERIDAAVRAAFPGHPVTWAYTSRVVRAHMKKKRRTDLKDLDQVLADLQAQGHPWAVVQSLHLICGHEFYRLVAAGDQPRIRTSIGLPLLCSAADYHAVVRALVPVIGDQADEAVILVGHGTDHPAWCAYAALEHMLQERFGDRVRVGLVDEGDPSLAREAVVRAVVERGFGRVRLIPFLLVAGVHFEEDLAGDDDSWKADCEAAGLSVVLENKGLGHHRPVVDLFCRHIAAALDTIPGWAPAISSQLDDFDRRPC